MATPPDHPTWLEAVGIAGFLAAVGPKLIEWFRANVFKQRKDDATVRVAEITSEDKFRAELMARVSQLEAQQASNINEISLLRTQSDLMRRQLEGILMRGEVAIGGQPEDIILALRQTLYELRAILGHPPYPKSTIIGDTERTQGVG